MKDYKNNVSFQNTLSHVKYYKQEAGIKTPTILIDYEDWNEANDTYTWIVIMQHEDTNIKIEEIMDLKFVHDIYYKLQQ